MTENDPLTRYAQDMRQITASPQLKAKALTAAQRTTEGNPPSANVKDGPRRTLPQANRSRAPWAIAACLAVAAGIGAFACLASQSASNSDDATPQSIQPASPLLGNVLQAYAVDSDTLTPTNENGEIIFTRTFETGMPTGEMYTEYGYYSGCLLSFSDTNAESVTFSIDRGQLYRCTIESFVSSSDRQRWTDALTWKQGVDHSGSSYSEYDYVRPLANTDGKSKTDPDKICRVETCLLLGQTATLSADQMSTSAKTTIGIWTNEPYKGLSDNPFDACMLALDGTQLSVEATYSDGSTRHATYELQAVCVQSVATGNAIASTTHEVSPDDSDANPVYTLKAVPVVTSTSSTM